MPKVVINQFHGGLAVSDRLGKEGSYAIGTAIDPLRQIGYLMPGFTPTNKEKTDDGSPTIGGNIKSFTQDATNSKVYGIEGANGSGDAVHRISNVDGSFVDDGTWPRTITAHGGHSAVLGSDVIIYHIGTTNYLFYAWSDNTDGDIGRVNLKATFTFDDDFMSAVSASGAVLQTNLPHPMIEFFGNGRLYIGDGKDLAEFDGDNGASGTFDSSGLDLPKGWTITCLSQTENFIVIGAVFAPLSPGGGVFSNNRTRSGVFFWDGFSDSYNRFFPLPEEELSAMINIDGKLFAFTSETSAGSYIRQFNGSAFQVVQVITDPADPISISVKPRGHGGVTPYRGGMIFTSGGGGGDVYFYGSRRPGIPPALYAPWKTGGGKAGYGITGLTGASFMLASVDGNSVGYADLYSSGYDTNAIYKSRWFEFPGKIRVNYVKFNFQTLATNQNATVSLEYNHSSSNSAALGTITFGTDGAVNRKRFDYKQPCDAFRVVVDHDTSSSDAVKIAQIVIDYDIIADTD